MTDPRASVAVDRETLLSLYRTMLDDQALRAAGRAGVPHR